MRFALSTLGAVEWSRILVVVLAGGVLLQGLPLRTVVNHVWQAGETHQCAHHGGVCPRNPDGSCPCDHGDARDASSPILQSCSEVHHPTVAPAPSSKWVPRSIPRGVSPRVTERPWAHEYVDLVPQRFGDEVFRPPRPMAG